ncbi:hypothetical protein HYQ46_003064 [Verticillium longisporum]|nr:hypothetical protein HYQ46_003064 [Verticillium longisporum]
MSSGGAKTLQVPLAWRATQKLAGWPVAMTPSNTLWHILAMLGPSPPVAQIGMTRANKGKGRKLRILCRAAAQGWEKMRTRYG